LGLPEPEPLPDYMEMATGSTKRPKSES
jgi:hypothetical protein